MKLTYLILVLTALAASASSLATEVTPTEIGKQNCENALVGHAANLEKQQAEHRRGRREAVLSDTAEMKAEIEAAKTAFDRNPFCEQRYVKGFASALRAERLRKDSEYLNVAEAFEEYLLRTDPSYVTPKNLEGAMASMFYRLQPIRHAFELLQRKGQESRFENIKKISRMDLETLKKAQDDLEFDAKGDNFAKYGLHFIEDNYAELGTIRAAIRYLEANPHLEGKPRALDDLDIPSQHQPPATDSGSNNKRKS